MARKDSVLGTPSEGDKDPAPWEAGAREQSVTAPDAGQLVNATEDDDDVERYTPGADPTMGGLIRPAAQGETLSREEALERLRRAQSDSSAVTVMGPKVQELAANLLEFAKTVDNQSTGVFEDIATRIENAQTADDVLADDSPLDAEDVVGVPLQLWDATINESDFKDGLPAYVALRAVRLDTHEDVVVTCGAFKVVAKAFKLRRIKAFPVQVVIKKSDRKTSNGYDVLDMVKFTGEVRF